MAFFKVFVMEAWPTTISKVAGRYFLAETTKFSMDKRVKLLDKKTRMFTTKVYVFA